MRAFLRDLENQPLAVRRRFVVAATASSFLLIVLLYVAFLSLRPGPRRPPPSPTPRVSPPGSPSPAEAPFDLSEISGSLLKALGGRRP